MKTSPVIVGLFGFLFFWGQRGDDLLRRAHDAFEDGDYARAVKLYSELEEDAREPGLIAYNKAAALYHLGQFREAEFHYRRTLEDAEETRRAGALYGLANSLVQQAESLGPEALAEAVRRYEECLALGEESPDPADVRHNLEVARLLWQEAKQKQKEPPQPDKDNGDGSEDHKPTPKPENQKNAPGGADPVQKGTPRPFGDPVRAPDDKRQKPIPTNEQSPATGNLPKVPDEDELVKLSPEDAAAHLRRAMEKIQAERRRHQLESAGKPAAVVKDW